MRRIIKVTSGMPASGKSSAINHLKQETDILLRRDDFRLQIGLEVNSGQYFPVSAKEEWRRWSALIAKTLTDSPNTTVWIDQTTLTNGSLKKLLSAMPLTTNDLIQIVALKTPFEKCLERNNSRISGRVPEKVMYQMRASMTKDGITDESIEKLVNELNIKSSIVLSTLIKGGELI